MSSAVIVDVTGQVHAAWQMERTDDCVLGVFGSDGHRAALSVGLPDDRRVVFFQPLEDIGAASVPYRSFDTGELLGPFITDLQVNENLLIASLGGPFWAFEGAESSKRGTIDEAPLPTGSHGGVGLAGRRMFWTTSYRYLATALGNDGPAEVLYQPSAPDIWLLKHQVNETALVWLEARDGNRDVVLRIAPRTEPPAPLSPRLLGMMEVVNDIALGEDVVVMRQVEPERLVAIDLASGRSRTFHLPEGVGIANSFLWIKENLVYVLGVGVVEIPNRPALLEFDLDAIPYDDGG